MRGIRTNRVAGLVCLLVFACGGQTAGAEEAVTVPPAGWSGNAELGVVVTSGNTRTDTTNGKLQIVDAAAPWTHTGRLEVLNSRNDGTSTADRAFVSGKTDYSLSEVSYLFGLFTYERDRFSGYEYTSSEATGYGHRFLHSDVTTLNLEAGVGARQSELSDTGERNKEGIVRGAGLYEHLLGKASRFREEVDTESGGGLTVTHSLTSLSAQIVGNLAAKFAVRITRTSDVPPGLNKTDTETSTTLVYQF